MALSLNPRTDNVPPLNDPRISLRKERLKVSALSMAAQEDPIIRQALLPYPSPGNMEVLAITFGVKRKAIGHEATRLRNLRYRASPSEGDNDGDDPNSRPEFIYYMYHKPPGCMSERSDRGKVTIYDAIPPGFPHVPHVGRLDKETVGLMLFTDDGALAAGLSNPTYFGIPDNWQPTPSVKLLEAESDISSAVAINGGDGAANNSGAADDVKETVISMKESIPSSVATHAQKVYHVCVTGLAWTSADVEWFDNLPQCSESVASSTTVLASGAEATAKHASSKDVMRSGIEVDAVDEKLNMKNDWPNNSDTNQRRSAARVIPLIPPLKALDSAKSDIGGKRQSFFDAHSDVSATSSQPSSSSLLSPQPPALHCGGSLSAKGWRWHTKFGTAREQLEALRHPLEYFGCDQSGRDVETTKPATVRFLGHPSFPAGSATTAGNGDAASRDGVDEATVASTATATAVTGAAASASTDMEPSLKPLPSNKAMSQTQGAVWLEFTLEEGRNRQIRRLCARSGLGVAVLRRMSFGALRLGGLLPGHARVLTPAEVTASYHAAFGPRDSTQHTSLSRVITPLSSPYSASSSSLEPPSVTSSPSCPPLSCPATVVPLPMTTAALDLDPSVCTAAAAAAYSKVKGAIEEEYSTELVPAD